MRVSIRTVAVIAVLVLAVSAIAAVRTLTVPAGTDVVLAFDQALSSKTTKVGQKVALHVTNNVVVNRRTVIRAGTKATGVISKVDKRKRYGVNAKMRIVLNPIKSVYGTYIPI